MTLDADVLVIGTGIAGLTFSLKAARRASILLITKKQRAETSTNYARGGIAAVLGDDDQLALHVEDTLTAGAGLCHSRVVEMLVREGPQRVHELMDWGTRFRHEGTLRRAHFARGEHHDVHVMGIVRDEWRARTPDAEPG